MTKNMTEGKSLPLILEFALPLLVGNLLQQMYNLADAAIVGQCVDSDALAAVGASTSVQFLVLGFCIGICCGFAIPVAQRFGASDYETMRRNIFHGGLLCVGTALILTTACALLCPQILMLLKTPARIYEDAYAYLLIVFLGIPFVLLYNLLSCILRAVGDSKTPFVFLVISTVLNIGLDFLFVVGFGWEVRGAAIATILAQGISGVLCFFYINRRVELLHLRREECQVDGHMLGQMASMGFPMGLQYSITAIGTMVMQSANNNLGPECVSAFAAASRIKQFAMCPFDAIATGVSTFAGQNLGAGKPQRIKRAIVEGIAIDVLYGLIIGIVLIFFGQKMVLLFLKPEETQIIDLAGHYLYCTGFFYWSLGFLNVARMTTQGIGYSGRAVFSGVVEMVARIIVALIFVPMFGFEAICFCDQSAWVSACFYIVPTLIYCLKLSEKKLARKKEN